MSNPILKALVTVSLETSNSLFLPVLSDRALHDVQCVVAKNILNFLDKAEGESLFVSDAISNATNLYLHKTQIEHKPTGIEMEDSTLKVSILMSCECHFDLRIDGKEVDASSVNLAGAQTAWESHLRDILTTTEFHDDNGHPFYGAQYDLKVAGQAALGLVVSRVEANVRGLEAPEPSAPKP